MCGARGGPVWRAGNVVRDGEGNGRGGIGAKYGNERVAQVRQESSPTPFRKDEEGEGGERCGCSRVDCPPDSPRESRGIEGWVSKGEACPRAQVGIPTGTKEDIAGMRRGV